KAYVRGAPANEAADVHRVVVLEVIPGDGVQEVFVKNRAVIGQRDPLGPLVVELDTAGPQVDGDVGDVGGQPGLADRRVPPVSEYPGRRGALRRISAIVEKVELDRQAVMDAAIAESASIRPQRLRAVPLDDERDPVRPRNGPLAEAE